MEYDNTTVGGAYAKGRFTKVTDPSGVTTYQYDALGRVFGRRKSSAPTRREDLRDGYQYATRTTSVTYPSGRNLSYAFDTQGRVTAVSLAGQIVLAGRPTPRSGRSRVEMDQRHKSTSAPRSGWASRDRDHRSGLDGLRCGGWTFTYDTLDRLAGATLPPGEAFALRLRRQRQP